MHGIYTPCQFDFISCSCYSVLYSHWYSYGLIALAIARAITGHSRTSESIDYSLIVLGSVWLIILIDYINSCIIRTFILCSCDSVYNGVQSSLITACYHQARLCSTLNMKEKPKLTACRVSLSVRKAPWTHSYAVRQVIVIRRSQMTLTQGLLSQSTMSWCM